MHEIMGFIWPMMAASAEAMIFLWIIVILVVIGRGKLLPSEKQIVIERSGQYKMSLAPGLNLAQPFIEAVAKQISMADEKSRNNSQFSYRVNDKKISSRKEQFYILSIAIQDNFISFEAKTVPFEMDLSNTKPSVSYSAVALTGDVEVIIFSVAKLWSVDLERVT